MIKIVYVYIIRNCAYKVKVINGINDGPQFIRIS